MSSGHTVTALRDVHARAHRALAGLMEHCAGLPAELATREIAGFGYPTLVRQFFHVLDAERYWFAVLGQDLPVIEAAGEDRDEPEFGDLPSLQVWRERRAAESAAVIDDFSDADVGTPRSLVTWGGTAKELVPAHIVFRVSTHIFDHKGRIAIMCKQLGHPIPSGLDFPLG